MQQNAKCAEHNVTTRVLRTNDVECQRHDLPRNEDIINATKC